VKFILKNLYYFIQTFRKYDITTFLRISHFLAQITHETGNFRWLTELGNKAYFNKYDIQYAPKKAKELGNIIRGDGYKFRGRGFMHLTGRANYQSYKNYSGIDVIKNPDLAARIDIALDIAGWYWKKNNINAEADKDSIDGVTLKINSAKKDLAERKAYLGYYKLQKLTLEFLESRQSA
jgi:putative chitinase